MALAVDLVHELNGSSGVGDLTQRVLAKAVTATSSDRGTLSWVEGDGLIVAGSVDPIAGRLDPGSRWPLPSDEVTRIALAAGRSESGPFRSQDFERVSPELHAVYSQLRHMMVTPVIAGGEPLAVIVVSRRRDEGYTRREGEALDLVASIAAQPLRAARLDDLLAQARRQAGASEAVSSSVEHTKTDVIRLASHELRGPLAVLHGYLALIRGGHFGEVAQPLAEVLAILDRRTEHMKSVVNDMLVAARIDEEPATTTTEVVDLRAVVHAAVTSVAPRAAPRHRLVTRVTDERVTVAVDTEKVELALRNVLDNAIKYSPHGGDVTCWMAVDAGTVTVRVRDTGLGIAPADRATLFTRFGRLVTPDNSHIAGIGLGLYYAREVMRRHGGDVTLEESDANGSVFALTLPVTGTALPGR